MPKFLTRYERRPVRFSSSMPSQTLQSDLQATLIPNIFQAHGVSFETRTPMFGDFSTAPMSLQDAYNRILEAQAGFADLPSNVRARFGNDPMQMIAFLNDPANRVEAEKLGLVNTHVSPAAHAAPAVQAGGTPSTLDVTVPGDTTTKPTKE